MELSALNICRFSMDKEFNKEKLLKKKSLQKKKDNINLSKINNDEICVSDKFFNDVIFDELNNSKYAYLLKDNKFTKIYFIRLWICYSNTYVFKAGFTTNLTERIKSLNAQFDSCGRIIILFAAKINGKYQEDDAHKKLLEYKINENIQNENKPQSREIYYINVAVYDLFLEYIKKITDKRKKTYFESNYYVITDENIEMVEIFEEYKKLRGFPKIKELLLEL
jgi:hypothetical protein